MNDDYTGMRAMPKDFPLKFVEKTDAEKLAEFKKALRESTIREYEYQKRIKELESITESQSKREAELVEGLKLGLLAIGEHNAPHDCYTTGPLTGTIADFLCPACSYLKQAKELIASSEGK
jgi:hypothetical protein